MRPYIDKTNPEIYKAMLGVSRAVRKAETEAGLSRALVELVNTRVSQLNGCSTCLSIHVPAAERAGVDRLRLDLLPAWRTAQIYSPQERATLGLAEALTVRTGTSLILDANHSGPVFEDASQVFSTEQIAVLEWVIITINAFNRISIASDHPVLSQSTAAES